MAERIKVWVQRFQDRKALMLQWNDPETGRRKSRSAKTADPAAAEKAAADLEYELNHGLHREPSKLTWAKFRELFEAEYLPNRRPNTRTNFAATFDAFERLAKPGKLQGVTARTVSAFAAALFKERGRGRAGQLASTVKVRLQFLHTALAWAARQKLLAAVPAFPEVKVPRKRPQPVPAESFEKLLAKAEDPQLRALLLCGWLAGLRRNEALALEWQETDRGPYLDPGRGRIVFPAEVVKAAEDQWVPLDPRLGEALAALPRQGRKVLRFADARGKDLTPVGVGAKVIALARAAGVRLTLRSLRRGFGCRYAGQVPAQVLQRLMRHSKIEITMTYYANVDAAVEAAVARMAEAEQRNTPRNTPGEGDPAPLPAPAPKADGVKGL